MSSSFEELLGRSDGSVPPVPSIHPPPPATTVQLPDEPKRPTVIETVAEAGPTPTGPAEPNPSDGGADAGQQPEPASMDGATTSSGPMAQVDSPVIERPAPEAPVDDTRRRVGFELPELDPEGAVRPMVDPADAERAVAEAVERAREEAFLAGVDEGMKREQSRLDAARGALNSAVAEIMASDERRSAEAEERIRVLAAGVAAHIVEREVRAAPELVSDLVRRAIAEFSVNDPLRVHLNPADIALLTGDAGGDLGGGRSIRWMPDPNIQSGGCLIEGSEQVVDARLPKTLERIVLALIDD